MKTLLVIAGLLVMYLGLSQTLECEGGWQLINENCFIFEQGSKVSYQVAKNFCQAQLPEGSEMAMIKSATTLRGVFIYITGFDLTGDFWLGGNDTALEGDWHWNDGTRMSQGTPFWALENGVLNWAQEPQGGKDQNCVILEEKRLYYFDDRSCDESHHALCMYYP